MARKRKPIKADPFAVWGAPPKSVMRRMTPAQARLLRRYVEKVTGEAYRIAFDNGLTHGLARVCEVAQSEWRKRLRA